MNDTERHYLIALSQSDSKAFDYLFTQYYPRLRYFIYHMIKNEDDARDLAQDVFIKIWERRDKMAMVLSFKSYLFTMAKNCIYDYYKESQKYNFEYDVNQYDNIGENNIEDELQYKDVQMLIDLVVQQMPKQRKNIFNMSRRDGLSNEEIAKELNISKRTVENHLTTALAQVRKVLMVTTLFLYGNI